MKNKQKWTLLISTLLLIFFIGLANILLQFQKEKNQDTFRKQVFCNEIRPGMDMEEIRTIINHYGNYREIPATVHNITYEIQIDFYDPKSLERIGDRDIDLFVENDRLVSVQEPVPGDMDMTRSICDE
jgi:hypothetical protein